MLRLGYALIDSTSAILTYRLVARIIYIDSQWYPRELASRCDLRFLVAPLEPKVKINKTLQINDLQRFSFCHICPFRVFLTIKP